MKSWDREFKGIFKSKEGLTKVFCSACTVDFGISHGDSLTLHGMSKTSRTQQSGVRDFYTKLTDRMLQKLPINDRLLKDIRVLDPTQKLEMNVSAVLRMADRLPANIFPDDNRDALLNIKWNSNATVPDFTPTPPLSFWVQLSRPKPTTTAHTHTT